MGLKPMTCRSSQLTVGRIADTQWLLLFVSLTWIGPGYADEPQPQIAPDERMPLRVHVFEDYETDIEERWWMRGSAVAENLPPSLSPSLPNSRVCRAAETKDFDDLMGDPTKTYRAVIFNPVPGPPMGKNTRLTFRYKLAGTDKLRVQIYSLTNNYHRRLELSGLPQNEWRRETVDMKLARRPDGSGGPLSADERIDDIQFYVDAASDLWIDDIILYEAPAEMEQQSFPARVIFTGWFDTGEQGQEWPGDFQIVPHEAPLTWDAARSVDNAETGKQWLRVGLRGPRPLGRRTHLRFRYRLSAPGDLGMELLDTAAGTTYRSRLTDLPGDNWNEATVAFDTVGEGRLADAIIFHPASSMLLIDDLLLYEPAD
jgi:hypothetical protein